MCPFTSQQNGRAGCNHFHMQEYGRAVCRVYAFDFPPPAVWTCRVYPFPLPAAWTCRVYPFFKFRNVGLSCILSVRYRNELKCRCWDQFGTGIRGPSPVPKCCGTGLRYRMPECRCRRHRPRSRCPAMLITYFHINHVTHGLMTKTCVCCEWVTSGF